MNQWLRANNKCFIAIKKVKHKAHAYAMGFVLGSPWWVSAEKRVLWTLFSNGVTQSASERSRVNAGDSSRHTTVTGREAGTSDNLYQPACASAGTNTFLLAEGEHFAKQKQKYSVRVAQRATQTVKQWLSQVKT